MQGVDKGGNILTRNSVHLPAFLVGKFSISYFFLLCYIRHIKTLEPYAIYKQSQENTAEPKLFLTSSQVLQFLQRGDLEER